MILATGLTQEFLIVHGQEASTPLVETQWNLVEINDTAVKPSTSDARPYIYLQQEGDKLSGSDGCNRLFGSYDLSGSSLQFHSVAQTLMACHDSSPGDGAEITEALKLTTSFHIAGDVLELRVDDRVLARFEARKR
jgi:heat shock protein HslJ